MHGHALDDRGLLAAGAAKRTRRGAMYAIEPGRLAGSRFAGARRGERTEIFCRTTSFPEFAGHSRKWWRIPLSARRGGGEAAQRIKGGITKSIVCSLYYSFIQQAIHPRSPPLVTTTTTTTTTTNIYIASHQQLYQPIRHKFAQQWLS